MWTIFRNLTIMANFFDGRASVVVRDSLADGAPGMLAEATEESGRRLFLGHGQTPP